MPLGVVVWDLDRRCVLKQWCVPLTRLPTLKPIEVVKALPGWPPVERSASTELMIGRVVPLAECRGAVVVAPQNLCDGCRFLRPLTIVAGKAGRELRNATRMHGVMVATREQRRAGRRAKRGRMEAVVAQPLIRQTLERRRVHRAAESTRRLINCCPAPATAQRNYPAICSRSGFDSSSRTTAGSLCLQPASSDGPP